MAPTPGSVKRVDGGVEIDWWRIKDPAKSYDYGNVSGAQSEDPVVPIPLSVLERLLDAARDGDRERT